MAVGLRQLAGGLTPLKALEPLFPKRQRKRPRAPRPEYSIDIKAQRAKRPRVTIQELAERGESILKERAPDLPRTDKRGLFTKVIDILDIPRNLIANAVGGLLGVDTAKVRRGTFLPKVWMSDILGKAGVPKGAVRSIIGFAGDVLVDPLTYYGLGATAGVKIARHLPRITGTGARAIKMAARTGRIPAELVGAMGLKRTGARLAAQITKGGKKRAQQAIARTLARRATKGAPEAVKLFRRYGERGRTLFRAPFAAKGVGYLPFGGRARRYQAVLAALTPKGRMAIQTMAKRRGQEAALVAGQALLAGRLGRLGRAGRALGAERKAQIAAARAKGGAPEAVAKAERGIRKALREKGKRELEPLRKAVAAEVPTVAKPTRAAEKQLAEAIAQMRAKGGAPAALAAAEAKLRQAAGAAVKKAQKGLTKKAQAELAARTVRADKARMARVALETGAEAPAIVREAGRAYRGRRVVPGERGAMAGLRRFRETLLGPPATPMTQQAVGARQRATTMARVVQARATADMARKIEPIAAQFAAAAPQAKKQSTAEAVRRLVFHLAEAGPEGTIAKAVMPFDPLGRHYRYAQKMGLATDPNVRSLLSDYWAQMERVRKIEEAAGISVGRIGGPVTAAFTPEARARMAAQEARGFRRPGEAPGLLSLRQAPGIQRGYFRLFRMPTGETRPILSSAHDVNARVAALKGQGAKEVGQAPISRALWNLWAKRPETAPVAFGPEGIGPPMKGGIFKESLPEAAGQRLAAHERSMAATQTRNLVEPWGIDLPIGMEQKDPRFAHFSRPKRPQAHNPMASLEQTGLYDRAYPKEVSDLIDSMTMTFDSPESVEKVLGASDRILGVWKSAQLYHPSYIMRNAVEKPLGVSFAGGDPLDATVKAFQPATRALRDALVQNDPSRVARVAFTLGGRRYSGQQLFDLGQRLHAVGAGRTAVELPARLGGPTGQVMAAGARKGWQRVHSAVFRMNTWMEDHQKLGAWLHFMDRGMDPEDAFMQTLRAAPDLVDLPIWSRTRLGRLFPWYRWRLKNGARMLSYVLPQRPGWLVALPKFRNFIEGLGGMERVPEELRPGWMEEGAYAQFMGGREGGMAFGLQTWFPGQEAYDVMGIPLAPERAAQRLAGELHPFAKAGIEAATQRSIFRQTPLQTVQEAGGWARALPRAFMGQSGTALDAALALRPAREWLPGGRVGQMETPGRAVTRAVLGGAVQPLDYQRGLRGEYYRLNRLQQQLRQQYNQAKNARDEALADQLFRQYLAVIKRMYQFKMPVPRTMEQAFQGARVPRPGPP